ncbi:hypothetical protein LG943_26945 [Streptomonospora sp. S1-112]|uniref:Uncharacterized protein n=1 Tax=Streptomonospora mangrovi TaxID=2883123 RepID=A0A9X3NTJ1_9ACTN|nr:hypothetical protein [Streptomonospora mangrovi]MDA0567931.1 hypothetical protein [Streptomonospora mangrovi]
MAAEQSPAPADVSTGTEPPTAPHVAAHPAPPAGTGVPAADSPAADIAASLKAGRELGPDYDDALAAAIVERLERTVDERVSARLAEERRAPAAPGTEPGGFGSNPRLVMGLLAMVFAIPLSAIGGSFMGAAGVVLAWVGLLVFYVVSVAGGRR